MKAIEIIKQSLMDLDQVRTLLAHSLTHPVTRPRLSLSLVFAPLRLFVLLPELADTDADVAGMVQLDEIPGEAESEKGFKDEISN